MPANVFLYSVPITSFDTHSPASLHKLTLTHSSARIRRRILVDVGVPWEVKEDISNALVAHCNAHPNVRLFRVGA
jgi:hypothetical protein